MSKQKANEYQTNPYLMGVTFPIDPSKLYAKLAVILPKLSVTPAQRPAFNSPAYIVGDITLFRIEDAADSLTKEPHKSIAPLT